MSIDPDSPWQDPNPPVPGRRNARTILAVSGVALVVVVVGALVGTVLRDKSLAQFDDTLVFQPRNVTTADPFTPDLAGVDVPFSDQAAQTLDAERETMTYDTDRGIRTVAGTTPGLYGGTGNNTSCNVDAAAQFLTENPDKGAAWASVFGITTDQIPYYLNTLTPVVLASDTWVTDHSFRNGQAVPYQSVLQAGTAVMVDPAGVPRVHCSCGNPMSPPADRPITDYSTGGTQWAEYEPDNVVAVSYADATPVAQADSAPDAVVPSPTVSDFQLLDLITAQPLLRAVGQLVNISAAAPLNAPLPDPVAMNLATKAASLVPIAAPAGADEAEAEVDEPPSSESPTTTTTTTPTTTTRPVAPIAEPTTTTTTVPSPARQVPPAVTTTLTTLPPAPAPPPVVVPSTTTPAVTTTTTTTTTTLPPTTTPADPPTKFSGPASGSVSSFALADGTSCRAVAAAPVVEEPVVPMPRNGSSATESAIPTTTRTTARQTPSSIEFTCTDGSTLEFSAAELSSAAIDGALVDGVWKVRTDSGSVAVTSATRTAG